MDLWPFIKGSDKRVNDKDEFGERLTLNIFLSNFFSVKYEPAINLFDGKFSCISCSSVVEHLLNEIIIERNVCEMLAHILMYKYFAPTW